MLKYSIKCSHFSFLVYHLRSLVYLWLLHLHSHHYWLLLFRIQEITDRQTLCISVLGRQPCFRLIKVFLLLLFHAFDFVIFVHFFTLVTIQALFEIGLSDYFLRNIIDDWMMRLFFQHFRENLGPRDSISAMFIQF